MHGAGMHGGAAPPTARVSRIDGLDLARFLALAGMFGTHLWLFGADGDTPPLVAGIEGKAAALFAALAGVGIVLSTRRPLAAGDARAARWMLAGRGVALVAIGLTLGLLPPFVLVILAFYGVTFWLAIPLLRWRASTLLVVAAVWAVVWPVASHALRAALGSDAHWPSSPDWTSLLQPLDLAGSLLVWGAYPALAWIVYVMVGMAIGRLLLTQLHGGGDEDAPGARGAGIVRLGLVVAGVGGGVAALTLAVNELLVRFVAVPQAGDRIVDDLRESAYGVTSTESWFNLLSTGPHTSTPFDLLITTGTSALAIGACLALGASLANGAAPGRIARRILLPVLGAGGAPLTVYSLHVVVASLTWALGRSFGDTGDGYAWYLSSPQLWLLHIAVALAIGLALRLAGRRGPLERFVTLTGRYAATIPGKPSRSS